MTTEAPAFVPCRWQRSCITKCARPITPRQRAAAERAVKREAEKMALFPDLRRWQTADERIASQRRRTNALFAGLREYEALAWRKARRLLRALPPRVRAGVVRYWNSHKCPARGVYLLEMAQAATDGKLRPWAKLRELRWLQLVGAGRLPRPAAWR